MAYTYFKIYVRTYSDLASWSLEKNTYVVIISSEPIVSKIGSETQISFTKFVCTQFANYVNLQFDEKFTRVKNHKNT